MRPLLALGSVEPLGTLTQQRVKDVQQFVNTLDLIAASWVLVKWHLLQHEVEENSHIWSRRNEVLECYD